MTITVGGTSITFNDATTQSTAANGTVTSVATGNGLSGGTITSSGTLVVACPTFNTVGSYAFVYSQTNGLTSGSNYAAGTAIKSGAWVESCGWHQNSLNNLSGTWKWMGATSSGNAESLSLACRVA